MNGIKVNGIKVNGIKVNGIKVSGLKVNVSQVARLSKRLRTPKAVQRFLHQLDYNREDTLRSAEQAARAGKAHCLEAAWLAAAILEPHGYPPLVMSMESEDGLDHVIFVFREKSKWGAVACSRDEGLYGRAPVFRSIRDLAWSYFDPYVDKTGRLLAYQVLHLDDTGADWRASRRNVWKAENYMLALEHRQLRSSEARFRRLRNSYLKRGPMPREPYWW